MNDCGSCWSWRRSRACRCGGWPGWLSKAAWPRSRVGGWLPKAEAPREYTEWDWTLATAIFLGSEGAGLHRLVRERCDALVRIPVVGHLESLNVSVAAGVLLFEALRQRLTEKDAPVRESKVGNP